MPVRNLDVVGMLQLILSFHLKCYFDSKPLHVQLCVNHPVSWTNITATIGWVAMKLCTDIEGHQMEVYIGHRFTLHGALPLNLVYWEHKCKDGL